MSESLLNGASAKYFIPADQREATEWIQRSTMSEQGKLMSGGLTGIKTTVAIVWACWIYLL